MNKLSILICVHSNSEKHDGLLSEALESLSKQTYKEFKVVAVMDECWHNTKSVLSSFNRTLGMQVFKKKKKEGLAAAKNFGLSKIDTEWVGFLDADDLYLPNKLEKQISYIKNNEVDFLGAQSLNRIIGRDSFFDSCHKLKKNETHGDISKIIHTENVLTHGSMLIKKSCLDKLGNYRDVKGAEDWDLWKRAVDKGFKFYQIQERLYVWTHNTSVPR